MIYSYVPRLLHWSSSRKGLQSQHEGMIKATKNSCNVHMAWKHYIKTDLSSVMTHKWVKEPGDNCFLLYAPIIAPPWSLALSWWWQCAGHVCVLEPRTSYQWVTVHYMSSVNATKTNKHLISETSESGSEGNISQHEHKSVSLVHVSKIKWKCSVSQIHITRRE